MTQIVRLPDKALIYATNIRGLLTFTEPDFPEVSPQVPGGTIEKDETPMAAAQREFLEETGLEVADIVFLKHIDQCFQSDGRTHRVARYFFHVMLPDDLPETWDHTEKFAHDGSPTILLRFSWTKIGQAKTMLGHGMAEALPLISITR